ncbi:hypothetical protein NECAME_10699 [Necator americanus]|uniref:Uncharacterized protein n=1 Tax=Necator americanus TaxID=51031 RepID=W2TAA8_NECAM|nr:hypothetical protein NECAME_10699 [Necator americanus]ETN77942.1 hypothetical protein NECAME_10699 [Necator americanus]
MENFSTISDEALPDKIVYIQRNIRLHQPQLKEQDGIVVSKRRAERLESWRTLTSSTAVEMGPPPALGLRKLRI